MGHERQPTDDWEIRQGIPEQWEIEDIEAGKPPGGWCYANQRLVRKHDFAPLGRDAFSRCRSGPLVPTSWRWKLASTWRVSQKRRLAIARP
jgi:hypothetical protein